MPKQDPVLDELKRVQAEFENSPAVSMGQVRRAIEALLRHAIEDREKRGGSKTVVGVKG